MTTMLTAVISSSGSTHNVFSKCNMFFKPDLNLICNSVDVECSLFMGRTGITQTKFPEEDIWIPDKLREKCVYDLYIPPDREGVGKAPYPVATQTHRLELTHRGVGFLKVTPFPPASGTKFMSH